RSMNPRRRSGGSEIVMAAPSCRTGARPARPRLRFPGSAGRVTRPLDPFPGVVVDLEGLLRRPLAFRDVLEVEPDPGPGAAAAAHRADQEVLRPQERPDVGMPLLPPLEALHRLVLVLGPGDLDQGHRRAPAAAGAAPLARCGFRHGALPGPRRLDTGGL